MLPNIENCTICLLKTAANLHIFAAAMISAPDTFVRDEKYVCY